MIHEGVTLPDVVEGSEVTVKTWLDRDGKKVVYSWPLIGGGLYRVYVPANRPETHSWHLPNGKAHIADTAPQIVPNVTL